MWSRCKHLELGMLSQWASITHFLDRHPTLIGQRKTVITVNEFKAIAKAGLHYAVVAWMHRR